MATALPTRRRLAPDERRAQLVAIGVAMIKERPFDQVLVDHVIDEAGISKGLLFHYFPSKRAYLAAVIATAADELLRAIAVDPDLPVGEQLHHGLDAFMAYIEQQPASYIAISRGAGSDEQLLAIFERTRDAIVQRVTAALGGEVAPLLRLAARGWVAMVEEATFLWLADPQCSRDELLELLEHAALQILPAAAESAG